MALSKQQLHLLQNIMGPVGATLACLMFLSSVDVLSRIVRKRSVGEYSYFPYLVQVCNCALWVFYCWADYQGGKMFWPLFCNSFGCMMATTSLLTYFVFCTNEQKRSMTWSLGLLVAVGIFGVWVMNDDTGLGSWAVGNACLVINMIMYYGPCAGIGHALATQSTEYMPLSLGIAHSENSF
eukprot:TRINITY_DN11170_c0_g1_i4.p1 TRINITY_DN11170_c0_g1~~TRINITY_DN11170_c0_g1_i4.p1  ORF type:complete len:181 (-),score=11.83 TRINITY_DN11170_c0_g1_i4:227-769(-)